MTARRRSRSRQAQLAFDAISIEGGLLSPEWLSRVAQLAAGQQADADYRIPKGLNVRDEIGRYWRVAQALWTDFARGRETGADARALAETFVPALLREGFGFASLRAVDPVVLRERSYPIGFVTLGGHVPVVVAPAASGLDTLVATFGDVGRRRSAFGVVQEYLNTADDALWGICCDGTVLRILRDNASLTRPAWIEADLQRIFTEEGRYADFAALWLLVHETRFGRTDRPATDCVLEAWRNAGREEGTRAREHLRHGVEEALVALGQGFLRHPDNAAVRTALQNGSLTTGAYFQQLLRLVYRLIFLLTVEERELLHPESANVKAKRIYAEGYGLRRLRERSVRRSAHDRHSDLWEATRIVFRGLAASEPRLGLPALAGIFAADQCPTLDSARLENRALLLAVFRLSWLREDSGLARVNWRDMGPEELGSVYESLLELVPQIREGGRVFAFATGTETKGNARKLTGSYYTPDDLVQVLLDGALEPVVESALAAKPERPVEALLELSIVDPACGSGHFLLAAARRVAAHVARLQSGGTPSAAEYRHALRQVVGRCVYGVDLNPMAVELCKVSLWMEAVEPGLPLTFLDSHIQCGNALLGTSPELMADGIPDDAWDAIGGDDKKVARALKKRNRDAASGQRGFDTEWAKAVESEAAALAQAIARLETAPDEDAEALARKESQWEGILDSEAYRRQKLVADSWCAAFVWPKQPGALAHAAPTNELWRQIRDGQGEPPQLTIQTTKDLAEQFQFFHWRLAFPQVFARGGFDAVVGNPPWDSLLFREEEFFAGVRPDIAEAPTAAKRKRMVARLADDDPPLFRQYLAALRRVDGANAFVRSRVRYPLCGVGRVNLYGLFAETGREVVARSGRMALLLPSGIVSDDSTKLFFQAIVEDGTLVSFLDFENREGIFPAVDSRMKFGILTLKGSPSAGDRAAEFVFFATQVAHIEDPDRRFTLSAADIALLNPATKTCPIFRTRRDAEITKGIYRRLPVLTTSGWKLELRRLLNSADDSGSFLREPGKDSIPLYEGKYFHHYDHRWTTHDEGADRPLSDAERVDPSCTIRPRYWYPAADACDRFGRTWKHSWVLAWRDIARSTDERTFIASVVPSLAVPDTAKVIFLADEQVDAAASLLANAGSFAFDFVARQKIGGTHMSAFIVEQLPILPAGILGDPPGWASAELGTWLRPRTMELTYTSWDLEPFAHDVGYDGAPFRWDPARRFLLRCELDAAFFHLYGLSHDDAAYVLDTFPIVRRNDEKAHGEYRTKRVILEIHDAMADAIRTGKPYETRVDPPPADARVAHPDTRTRRW